MVENSDGEIKKITKDDKGIFSVVLENDLFTGTDLGYTNGARFSYISPSEFTEHDFLYAGWLYGSLGLSSDTGSTYDNLVMTLGVVGPSAKGGETQDFIHHAVEGSPQPKG